MKLKTTCQTQTESVSQTTLSLCVMNALSFVLLCYNADRICCKLLVLKFFESIPVNADDEHGVLTLDIILYLYISSFNSFNGRKRKDNPVSKHHPLSVQVQNLSQNLIYCVLLLLLLSLFFSKDIYFSIHTIVSCMEITLFNWPMNTNKSIITKNAHDKMYNGFAKITLTQNHCTL